jgi:hypothetical protein
MAVSLINTECKRYGCIKNLLACYANCRYNTRCDDLRNEIEGKTDQAVKDINQYLSERGSSPIAIQFVKRGLKFTKPNSQSTEAARPKRLKPSLKLASLAGKPEKIVSAKKRIMSRKAKNTEARNTSNLAQPAMKLPGSPDPKEEKKPEKRKTKPRKPKSASSNGRAARKNVKTFIILEGRTASLVDERGLMQHILSGASTDVRYFEAIEVEARLQIVARR